MEKKLVVYNSLNKKKESFKSIEKDNVGMYVCGPTVYSNVHLGNCRTFISFDLIFRYLQFIGYKVRYVRNITDVGHLENDADEGEDRIAKKARLESIEPMEVVQRYTTDFRNTMAKFNTLPPSIEPTATGHIVEQIEFIKKIIDQGYAYQVNGSVYFDVIKFNQDIPYGKLSKRKIEELIHNSRILDGQTDKRNPQDFSLWKKAEPKHIMRWPSPWSDGFPGWHLECTAMSTKYLGKQFDIHGGGLDLIFPHHENEIAQSCSNNSSEKFSNYWVHNGFVTINKEKMSKSLGNIISISEAVHKYSGQAVRLALLSAHYSQPLDWNDKLLKDQKSTIEKWYQLYEDSKTEISLDVIDVLLNDLNTPGFIAKIHELYKVANKGDDKSKKLFNSACKLIGLFDLNKNEWENLKKTNTDISEDLILKKIAARTTAKKNRDFKLADQIRNELLNKGIIIEDQKDKTIWKYK